MVKLLLANHAKVDQQDQGGRTPLMFAAERADSSIAAALLEAKADPNLRDREGWTALNFAVQRCPLASRKAMVELLLAKGADSNTRDNAGSTPLGTAANLAHQANRGFPGAGIIGPPAAAGAPPPGFGAAPGKPSALPVASPSLTPEQAALVEIVELLRQHGAVEDLPRLDVIEIRRPEAKDSRVVFSKGANDYNRFTLFELLAVHYGFVSPAPKPSEQEYRLPSSTLSTSLSFPDLDHVTIRRPTPDGLSWGTMRVGLRSGDLSYNEGVSGWGGTAPGEDPCRGNLQLQWGDVVEISQKDHPLNAVWQGLPEQFVPTLKHCVDRQVQLTVKGQTTNLVLHLQIGGLAGPVAVHHQQRTPPSFALWAVLQNSGLLRASSDLSHVKVKRARAQPPGEEELALDCSDASNPGAAFWLRDGDAIEVPERQSVSNALGGQ